MKLIRTIGIAVMFSVLCVPLAAASEIIAKEGVYVKYDNGIVRDTSTGLEWVAGPDEDTTLDEARRWVQSLDVDGGGWHMPTYDELKTLYREDEAGRNLTPLLRTSGFCVYSGDVHRSGVLVFDFSAPDKGDWRGSIILGDERVFAVRSRGDR